MALKLIHGPPNSGRAGLIRSRFVAALDRDPVLVVPNLDDVFGFERELCEAGATVGGSVMAFSGLFAAVAASGGTPQARRLTPSQRRRAIAIGVAECRGRLGPLRRSSQRSGFAASLERLFDELQGAGVGPAAIEAGTATLEGSAYLGDLAMLLGAYEGVRARLGRADAHSVAREAIRLLAESGEAWRERPVFIYGLDDLTPNQLELLRGLSAVTEVTVALPLEDRDVLASPSRLAARLREGIGVAEEVSTKPDPANTPNPLLFHLERNFGKVAGAEARELGEGLTLLRSAGVRGEAEAIAAAVGGLLHRGAKEEEIAVVLRDPTRRGPLLARVLESYGVAVALEAELPVSRTGVGGALLALLEAEHRTERAADVLRWMRGPSGIAAGSADWLERSIRRRRVQTAAGALELWLERNEDLPYDLRELREAGPTGLVAAVGETARRMVARFLADGEDGPQPRPGDGTELSAAATIAATMAELSEPGGLAPGPAELIGLLGELSFRAWRGPVEGRVRIADPRRLRASRFDHVVIGSLQDGEFPRRGGGDPFLSDIQRESLGLDPRRDDESEERYLFYTSLSLARESIVLSYRDSDEAGAAEARSPLLDDVRRLLDPPPPAEGTDPVEVAITGGRGLAEPVYPVTAAPSVNELARSASARDPETAKLLDAAGPGAAIRERIEERIESARQAEARTKAPGPLTNPAAIESLHAVHAYGGTTLERFDECSYRWFVDHELRPQALEPLPDPIVQGGLMHRVLDRLYRERPGGDPRPRPSSLSSWERRGREHIAELADGQELGAHPAERAIRRSVERLLSRFLGEEAGRDSERFEPWLLEAKFGEDEDSERPALEIDGWFLHGAIDRADRAPDGRTLVHDYKVASRATAAKKLEEEAKLQLQLYLLAVAKGWEGTPIGALYHPLRATRERRPRGFVLDDSAADLASYGLAGTDVVGDEEFEQVLEEARLRAGGIVARMREGDIRRDPGPREGLRDHDVCPTYCDFAPICRRDRGPASEEDREPEER
jgi:ATP-dependent helicase/DNAse subunit B